MVVDVVDVVVLVVDVLVVLVVVVSTGGLVHFITHDQGAEPCGWVAVNAPTFSRLA